MRIQSKNSKFNRLIKMVNRRKFYYSNINHFLLNKIFKEIVKKSCYEKY